MNVAQLIKRLQDMNPRAQVFVEREGEHRQLNDDDIREDDGDGIRNADAENEEEEEVTGPVVVFTSWS